MRINEEIRIREVRVTDENGESLGIMQTKDALKLAEDRHLDLVEVAPPASLQAYGFRQVPLRTTETRQRSA